MKKIITSPVPQIYLVLDKDARKRAIKHCRTFLDMGKEVFFVEPKAKDPSEEGFEVFTRQIQKAESLSFSKLVELELST